ncbi:hypothetical protein QJS04_geneDACA005576 [Acorus gramineus]|uniref:AB hydrolase-1 domain-containing protein n=1 Tax=Acorus gramineus TaxID=55184 RepID=A0AAV9A4T9_ACOGR|nr:hypothetical protein QJS04_geneDACA005576 [Acorus gramineus]
MVASLLVLSAPVLVAVGDVVVSLALMSSFSVGGGGGGLREELRGYGFRRSLIDVPMLSVVRSFIITFLALLVKACVYAPVLEIEPEASPSPMRHNIHLNKSWEMPALFLSSLVFALGHVVVAYRTSCRARRKLLFHRIDPEAVLACKNVFSGYQKVPRSPTPCTGKMSKSDSETRRRATVLNERDLSISLLADVDSLFITCRGLIVHYKLSFPESSLSHPVASISFPDSTPICSSPRVTRGWLKLDRPPLTVQSKSHHQLERSFSNQFHGSSLYAPLLDGSATSPAYFSEEIPVLSLDEGDKNDNLPNSVNIGVDADVSGRFGIVLIHGFGGGVFSWRHVMGELARQVGCTVVAFDRPGWGLTSRIRRKDWEEKQLPNPYKLESQFLAILWNSILLFRRNNMQITVIEGKKVDLLLSFCSELGFSSVVLVGHDDGGLLALKTAEKILASGRSVNVQIKGVVLLNVSLSREVVPAFARILLHTSLRKKHMVRPLLRTEITQVINRRAWYNVTKLTTEVMNLYKESMSGCIQKHFNALFVICMEENVKSAPLCVEGWDEALHEIGRLSFANILSSQNAAALLKSVEQLPVLVVAGAENTLVPLKSTQAMASKLVNSRLVAISGCGHLPHEECPKALLAALSPFITRLLSSQHRLQRQ